MADLITATDRAVLAELEVDPVAPWAVLAERVGVSERTVARRYEALRGRGLVRVVGRTLPTFGDQVAWLMRARVAPASAVTLGVTLTGHSRTRWVRATRDLGELVYGLVSPGSSVDRVLERLPDLPGVRSLRAHELVQLWSRHGVVASSTPLDATDHRIIGLLAADGRARNRDLGHRIGVDETTVARRRRRLEESGVLYYEADIAQDALGRRIDAMVWATVPPGRIEATGRTLQALPECRFVAATTGPTTVVANVATTDNAALVQFVDTHLAGLATTVEMQTMGRIFKRTAGAAVPV